MLHCIVNEQYKCLLVLTSLYIPKWSIYQKKNPKSIYHQPITLMRCVNLDILFDNRVWHILFRMSLVSFTYFLKKSQLTPLVRLRSTTLRFYTSSHWSNWSHLISFKCWNSIKNFYFLWDSSSTIAIRFSRGNKKQHTPLAVTILQLQILQMYS